MLVHARRRGEIFSNLVPGWKIEREVGTFLLQPSSLVALPACSKASRNSEGSLAAQGWGAQPKGAFSLRILQEISMEFDSQVPGGTPRTSKNCQTFQNTPSRAGGRNAFYILAIIDKGGQNKKVII